MPWAQSWGWADWGYLLMEHQMEKKMENEMEAGII